MKRVLLTFLALAPLVAAQEIKFPPGLEKLEDRKDVEVVDVTLDAKLLDLASRFLSDKDPDEAKVKKLVKSLQGVYVKSLEFDNKGAYDPADVEYVRNQLKVGWSRIVGVRNHRDGENAEVYVKYDGEKIGGLVVIVAEPRELTLVNIVGSLRPEDLRDLGGNLGIPRFDVNIGGRDKSSSKED